VADVAEGSVIPAAVEGIPVAAVDIQGADEAAGRIPMTILRRSLSLRMMWLFLLKCSIN
jgi:hypothetical protein